MKRDPCCAAFMNSQGAGTVVSAGPHRVMLGLERGGQVSLYHKDIWCRFYVSYDGQGSFEEHNL